MALTGEIKTEKKGDENIEVFLAKFNNGTLDQLRELAAFLKNEGFGISDEATETDVVRVAISFLATFKKNKEDKATDS